MQDRSSKMLLTVIAIITMVEMITAVNFPPIVPPEPIGGCPNSHLGYRLNIYSNTCVRFVPELKSWMDAKAYCQNAGENMATFRSLDDAAWLRHQQLAGGWTAVRAWLGGRRADGGSPWAWYGQVTGEIPYAYWSNISPHRPDRDHCLGTARARRYFWDNAGCTQRRNFFCERAP